ncbi:MAG: mechanosensitive ion channel domain-containing protein [Rhodomicrobium sp.]
MVVRHGAILCSFFAMFAVLSANATAQVALTLPGASAAAQPSTAAPAAPAPQAAATAYQPDMAAIAKKANSAVGLDIDAQVKSWRMNLDRIEQGIHDTTINYTGLNTFRGELFKLRADAEDFAKKLEPVLNSANEDVQALPPPPAQGQPPELEQAAITRADATAYLGYLTQANGAVDGTHNRVAKLLGSILDVRRSRVTNNLFHRQTGAFFPGTWKAAPGQITELAAKVRDAVKGWWRVQDQDQIMPLAGEALALWLGLTILSFVGARRLRRWEEGCEPPFWRRASDAANVILLKSLPAVLPLIFLYNAVDQAQPMPNDIGWLFYSGARSIIIIAVVNALVSAALSPRDHRWRLIASSNAAALRISGLMLTMAIVYGAATFVLTAASLFKAPDSPKLALTLVPNAILALLAVAVLETPLRKEHAEGLPSASWLRILRLPVWLIAIAIIATAASGYVVLSRFIAQQLIVTGAILAIVYLMLLWADGIAQSMGNETSTLGSWLATTGKLDQGSRQRLSVPVSLLLKLLVLLSAIPLILNQWQFAWTDILEWYRQLFFGFRVGSTQVSLAALLASIAVFILGYFAAKFFQQWLDNQVLKPAGLSGGLRDSIRTGVGYIGVSAAALIALSYAGLNLSNLAIVAGAFSVGIGFGLQTVVSNFVSGLILLAERPIKVGDWIVVGGEEGYVRKISVRSTEIETFDRASVLIPNSLFISDKVKNWTLRNNTGRLAVPVSVAYGCDPRAVKAILLQAAQAHLGVMRSPEPFVDFEDFESGKLNFKLYAYVYDLEKSVSIRTDLRIAILDALKAAGIVIFSPQDIVLQDMDWLRDAVKLYVANAEGPAPGNRRTLPATDAAE